PSVADSACQVNGTVRFSAPWMLCTKSFWFADQALLVRFGLWQKLQLGESLRCPAWKSGPTPSVTWQPPHLVLSTMGLAAPVASFGSARRPRKPVATIQTSGGGTMRPPWPAAAPGLVSLFSVYV